jgi:phage tail protein X
MSVITSTTGLAKAGSFKLLPYALVAAVALAVASAAGGFYAGQQFERGRAALAQLPTLRADAVALSESAQQLRRNAAESAARFRRSALALDLIRARHEDAADELRKTFAAQGAVLDDYLAARPDLSAVRLDADGVQLWNAAARAAEPAQRPAGADRADPTHTVPGEPAGAAGGRVDGGHAAGLDGSGGAVPRLPERQAEPSGLGGDL